MAYPFESSIHLTNAACNLTFASTTSYITESSAGTIDIYANSVNVMTLTSSGMALTTGAFVDTIETTLTNDDTHLPTSGAVFDAIDALSSISVTNQVDNRIITATGTTDVLNAEANLTFDGTALDFNNTDINIGYGGAGRIHIAESYSSILIGNNASAWSTGSSNIFIGNFAGDSTNSAWNVMIGVGAGRYTDGDSNVCIGLSAGLGVSGTSTYNDGILIGLGAGESLTTANGTVAIGTRAANVVTTQTNNVAVGLNTMRYSTGHSNMAVGTTALQGISGATNSGNNNMVIGYSAGLRITTGSQNVAVGSYSLQGSDVVNGITSSYNVAVGYNSLNDITTGGFNVAIGGQSGSVITTGTQNIVIGYNAGNIISTGDYNVIMGYTVNPPSGADAQYELAIGYTTTHTITGNLSTGELAFPQYGVGSFSGTVAYALAVDSSGNIIETTFGSGSGDVSWGTASANYVVFGSATGDIQSDSGFYLNTSTHALNIDGGATDGGELRLSYNAVDTWYAYAVSATSSIQAFHTSFILRSFTDGAYIGIGDTSDSATWVTLSDPSTTTKTSILRVRSGDLAREWDFRDDGSWYVTGLGSDDTEDHVLAIDDTTGLITKRAVSTLIGNTVSFGTAVDEIPFTNSGLNDFDYSSDFIYNGTTLSVSTTLRLTQAGGGNPFALVNSAGNGNNSFSINTGGTGFFLQWQGGHSSSTTATHHGGAAYLLGGNQTGVGGGDGGGVYLYGGSSNSGTRGQIYFGDGSTIASLQARSTETNVVYYDTTTGLLTYGTPSAISGWDVTSNLITPAVAGDDVRLAFGEYLYFGNSGTSYIRADSADASPSIAIYDGGVRVWASQATYVTHYIHQRPSLTDSWDIGTSSLWWKDVYAQKYIVDDATAYISYSGTELQFTDGVSSTVTLSSLVGGASQWTTDTNGITYTAGNVGIGVASNATYDLRVAGTAYYDSKVLIAGGADVLQLYAGATSDHVYMEFFADSAAQATRSAYFGYAAAGTSDITLGNQMTGGDIILLPGTGGYVGIGTSLPSYNLHVVESDGAVKAELSVSSSSRGIYFSSPSTADYTGTIGIVGTNSDLRIGVRDYADAMLIDGTNGNVGIGTSSPGANLEVSDTTDTTIRINSTKNGTWVDGEEYGRLEWYSEDLSGLGAGVRSYIKTVNESTYGARSRIEFGVTDGTNPAVTAMTIDGAGDVGIGTTSPSYTLDVNGTAAITTSLRVGGTTLTSGYILELSGTNNKGRAADWTATSDIRLKTNFEKYDSVLPGLMGIYNSEHGLTLYNRWVLDKDNKVTKKFDSERELGFIAQEVMPYFPDIVQGSEEEYYDISYMRLGAIAAMGVAELKDEKDKEIEQLKNRVSKLEQKLARYGNNNN